MPPLHPLDPLDVPEPVPKPLCSNGTVFFMLRVADADAVDVVAVVDVVDVVVVDDVVDVVGTVEVVEGVELNLSLLFVLKT